MNVLLTCVGRRDYLVGYFKHALAGRGHVFAANTYSESAGMAVADKGFVVPPVTDRSYIEVLLRICKENEIKLIVPLIDLDVMVLSKAKGRFASSGTVVIAPSPEISDTCMDKWKTHLWAGRLGVNCPETYIDLSKAEKAIEKGDVRFPLVIKPRWGTGSMCIEFSKDGKELRSKYREVKEALTNMSFSAINGCDNDQDILIQEKLAGTEYGMDVFNDLKGNFLTCLVKEKLEMRAGETDRARTVLNDQLSSIGEKIARNLRHIGNLDVDIVVQEDIPYLLEINHRFGGHYPFAHAAGADLPSALVNMVLEKNVKPEWLNMASGIIGAKGIRIVTIPQDSTT
jgi:carbamoyl-phosphate synthase large subunit